MPATVVSLFTGEILEPGAAVERPAPPIDGRYRPGEVFSYLYNLSQKPAEEQIRLLGLLVMGGMADREEASRALTLLQLARAGLEAVNLAGGGDDGRAA